uniref:Uncharacterized protein n=1 Tax=Aureoumbra lagunensis TaxID=44058 RepID=A0A7S3K5C3_9STRA|mmetsp:Transcript_7765/g.11760  ORF Transcript_7765/g.11760 Transcript_7765/m.11760 type:complete len:365 (+) Transcript_7765:39-1133(+)
MNEMKMLMLLTSVGALNPPMDTASLSNLLLQRAVQTMACYYTEVRNEYKAEWLASFGQPGYDLGCEPLSDREVRAKFHGLDALCEESIDYLRSMASAAPFTLQVRYKVGTPWGMPSTAGGAPDGFTETAQAGMNLWGISPGAASRRRNPYLQDCVRYIEYEEEINPEFILDQLKATRINLAEEFESDIKALILQARAGDERAYLRDNGDSTPLRYASLDLMQRLATREAAIHLLINGELDPSSSHFLSGQLKGEKSDESHDEHLTLAAELTAAACRLTQHDVLAQHYRTPGLAEKFLQEIAATPAFSAVNGVRVKPRALAKRLERKRCDVLEMWADDVIQQIHTEHSFIDNVAALEKQMKTTTT